MVLLLLVVFVSTNLAVLVLRRDREHVSDHFRAPTIVPVLALGTCIALMTQQSASTWLRAGALVLVGLALYGLTLLGRRRAAAS